MDSYGIHSTMMENETAANHIININQQRKAFNNKTLATYNEKVSNLKGKSKESKEESEGMEAKDVAMAIPDALSAAKMTKKYGGLGHALTEGTRDNLFHYAMPGGKAFVGKMGPAERAVRGVADPSLDKAAAKVAGRVGEVAGKVATSAGEAVSSVSSAIAKSGALGRGVQAQAQFAEHAAGAGQAIAGQEAVERQLVGEPAGRGILGQSFVKATGEVAEPGSQVGKLATSAGEIASAQIKDFESGYHGDTGKFTNPAKSVGELEAGIEPSISKAEHSLSIPGAIVKKGLTTLGKDAASAQLAGAVTDVGIGAAGSIYTGVKDFAMGGWQKEGTMSKVGDVTGIVGGALDAAAVAVPVLAPVAGLFDIVGAALDIGGEGKTEEKQQAQIAQPQQKQMMNVNPGTYQSANVSAPSAITKMKMTGGGGSY